MDLDLMRIPIIVAHPFMWELRCLRRIDPATAILGSHCKLFFIFTKAIVIKKA
jgi:hypothetical protein